MKKIVLSAAIVCACIGSAFAQTSSTPYTGNYSMQIQDFITLTPSGVQGTINTQTFSTPASMVAGQAVPVLNFQVVASRAWHVDHSSTSFTRTGPGSTPVGIAGTAPASCWQFTVTGGAGNTAVAGTQIGGTNNNIVTGATGTVGSNFSLAGTLVPGLGNGNLSGTYQNTITVIASLN